MMISIKLPGVIKFTQNLKHLKQYNLKNREACSATEYVYATEHLPKELQEQKKRLLPFYKDARNNKKKTVRKIQNCEYCLFVDDVRVRTNNILSNNIASLSKNTNLLVKIVFFLRLQSILIKIVY